MGMRLSISRSIIEAHGDHIWASAASPYGALLAIHSTRRGGVSRMTEEPPVVMVIDDDPSLRKAIDRLLRAVDLRVELFESAQEFLQSDRPDAPTCIVLDVRLPGQSGLNLQRHLAAADIHIPIIFITAHGDIPMSVLDEDPVFQAWKSCRSIRRWKR
jgi:CheY-like chemotaxis protein